MVFFYNKLKNLKEKLLIFKIKFLRRKKEKKVLVSYNNILGISIWCACLLLLFFNPKFVFNLYNNFRQAESKSLVLKSFLNHYDLYNENNYILEEKEEIVEPPKKDINTDFERLDELVNKKELLEVFNSVPDMNIYENSSYVQKALVGSVNVMNYSYLRNINYSDYIRDASVILTKKSDKIFLYNTHTSESYANSDKYQFEYSGTRRSQDANYNMLRIAKTFKENLNEMGFIAIHDTTPHDYGSYTSAYQKSRITLQNALSSYGGFGVCFDVHRDAIEDIDFAPKVEINGVSVAKVMFVLGAGNTDYTNKYFEDNLKLALKIQYIAEKVYPGLFRPMFIRNSVYNQDMSKYSLLIEVGASGNTIEESENATRCLTNLLNIIYKD